MTNHFLQFLALDRSDPKKFQILQIIAALLNWTDEQKEQAGLTRPGATFASNTGSFRLLSPSAQRTPSTSALFGGDYFGGDNPASPGGSVSGKESLAELWQSFLEQEASSTQPGRGSLSAKDRRESSTSVATQSTTRGQ